MAKDLDLLVIAQVDLWWHIGIRLGQKDDVAALFAVAALGHEAHCFGLRHQLFHAQILGCCAALGVKIKDCQHQVAKWVKRGVLHDHTPIIAARWCDVIGKAAAVDQGCAICVSGHALGFLVKWNLGAAAIGLGFDFEAAKHRVRANAGNCLRHLPRWVRLRNWVVFHVTFLEMTGKSTWQAVVSSFSVANLARAKNLTSNAALLKYVVNVHGHFPQTGHAGLFFR